MGTVLLLEHSTQLVEHSHKSYKEADNGVSIANANHSHSRS